MLGVVVNSAVIVVCSLAGAFFVRNVPARFEAMLRQAIGLSIAYIGLKGAFENTNILLLILSMVAGGVIGECADIDGLFKRAGVWAERLFTHARPGVARRGSVAQGFAQASILFCSGSMAIVGALRSGLEGNHETLFAKSVLDGSISIFFAASMGPGVALSALPVFVYQGAIAALSGVLRDVLTPDMIREMSATGSLLVAAIGFNFLGIKEIKVANLIPGVVLPALYFGVLSLLR